MTKEQRQIFIEAYMGGDDFIEFEGFNCHELFDDGDYLCQGWDGESPRCDCGNRRVYWAEEDGALIPAAD